VIGQSIAERLPEIVGAAASAFRDVDNATVLNGAQGIGEIMSQVSGQAGPALRPAREALAAQPAGHPNGAVPPEQATVAVDGAIDGAT
jgi:hypothetical protein